MQDIADTSGNCGSSFDVTIVSPDFAKKLPLARHKMGASTTFWRVHMISIAQLDGCSSTEIAVGQPLLGDDS